MKANADAAALAGADNHDHDHEAYVEDYFLARTLRVERLTPAMIRVVLKVEGGERLVPSGHPDEWVRLALRPDTDTPVTLPVPMENGRWGRPDGSKPCPNRPYTIRRWNPASCEMTIDIVVHEGGVAAGWAMTARVGDIVGICNPEGRFWLPKASRWLLLLCDLTGLPAVCRILEELPAGFRAVAHVEVPSEADRQAVETRGELSLTWHVVPGRTELPRIAGAIAALPPGPGYVWIAGEASAAAACRRYFRDGLGVDKQRITSVGYWIEGQART